MKVYICRTHLKKKKEKEKRKINCALPSLNIVSILSFLSLNYKIYQCTWEYTNYLLPLINEQSLATKLVVAEGYNHTILFLKFFLFEAHLDYIFFYILHACKNFKKLKINSYIINKLFKL